jgi:hypothetical protein
MLTAIRNWVIKTMMKGQTGVVRTLPKREIIELNTQITAERMMRNGINPQDMKNVNQVENVVNQINQPKVIPADSAEGRGITEQLLGKKKADVMDMEGNKIPEGSKIMGGKKVEFSFNEKIDWLVKNVDPNAEQTIPPKFVLQEMLKDGREDLIDHFFEIHTKNIGSKPVIDIDTSGLKHPELVKKMMTDQKLKPTLVNQESDAAIKARLDAGNKKGIASIQISLVDDSIAKIKSLEPMDAMKEANLVAGKKGRYANLDDNQVKKIMDDTQEHIFQDSSPLDDYATGGRVGYKVGSVDKMRRLFLQAIGAGAGTIGAAKSGLFSFGKGATKQVAKEVAQQTTSGMPPPYFFKLAEKIKMMGDDATATTERTIAKTLKSKDGKSTYLLEEDITSGDTIIKKINKEGDEMITDVEIMELKKGEVVMGKNGKPVKVPDEYEEVTESNSRIYKDEFNDPDYTDGIKVDEIIKEVDDKVPSIKYASGGLAYMLGE